MIHLNVSYYESDWSWWDEPKTEKIKKEDQENKIKVFNFKEEINELNFLQLKDK